MKNPKGQDYYKVNKRCRKINSKVRIEKDMKKITILAIAIIGVFGSTIVATATVMYNENKTAGAETVLSSVDNFPEGSNDEYDTMCEADPEYIEGAGVEVIFDSLDLMSQEELQQLVMESLLANSETEEVPVVEENTLWGYRNLGVANVTENLNIRKSPDTTSEIVGKLPKDAGCEIVAMEEGWANIKSGKVEGYVSLEYLFTGEAAVQKAKEVAKLGATVTADTLKIRKEATTNSGVRALIGNGTTLEVVEQTEGWVKVVFEDTESYVSAEYVSVGEKLKTALTITEEKYGAGVTDAGLSLVQYAVQFVGNPYVYGGVSLTNGADCSGFTLSVFRKYGVALPHTARGQSGYGTPVDISALMPGDLVFYSRGNGIDHVTIYIGNGQVVHASSPTSGIKISSLYYRTPYCARRIL